MSAMRQFARPSRVRLLALVATPLIFLSVLVPIKTSALTYKSAPARFWGNVVASDIAAKENVRATRAQILRVRKNPSGESLSLVFQMAQKKQFNTRLMFGHETLNLKYL